MAYKRILTIQDISCVGQCSMTVALPILSACGHETCILPTALLSTHTGGFGQPRIVHFDDALPGMVQHWRDCGISFDAVLVGYLGSLSAVETAGEILETLLATGGIGIVDPAMADNGRLYSGFDEAYVRAMRTLCEKAHILLPNVTEAALLCGVEHPEKPDIPELKRWLSGFDNDCVILTGVGNTPEETGVLVRQGKKFSHYCHRRVDKGYSGTGDIFAACFTGALMQGQEIQAAVKIAADFTLQCIETTAREPAYWYGIRFEPNLPMLGKWIQRI